MEVVLVNDKIKIFNGEEIKAEEITGYHFNLDEKTLQNYHKLQEYLREHLKEKDLYGIYDMYLKTLDSTRCDIPDDLQEYWIKNKERLGLKGKFLPDNSRLKIYVNN